MLGCAIIDPHPARLAIAVTVQSTRCDRKLHRRSLTFMLASRIQQ